MVVQLRRRIQVSSSDESFDGLEVSILRGSREIILGGNVVMIAKGLKRAADVSAWKITKWINDLACLPTNTHDSVGYLGRNNVQLECYAFFQVANVVMFLASDDAAMVTGSVFAVDGGSGVKG